MLLLLQDGGRRVTLTIRKEDPQARLLHTLHVFISLTFQEVGQDNQAQRCDNRHAVCAERPSVETAVPVVDWCEPSSA